MTYVAESSPDKRRNSLGSGLEIGTLSGYIAASIMIAVLTFFLTDEQWHHLVGESHSYSVYS